MSLGKEKAMYDYSDYYDYYDYSSTPAFNPLPTIISLVLCVFVLVCMWIIFRKAGKPGWAAIVPFYNLYVLFDITWGSGMRFLLMLIPFYNIILGIQTRFGWPRHSARAVALRRD